MARKKSITNTLSNAMGANAATSAVRLNRVRTSGGRFSYARNSTSTRGRMTDGVSSRAGGVTNTMSMGTGSGNTTGRGGDTNVTRRQRYYDVRVGLGLVGG